MELADIAGAKPYLEMGVQHFCIGWDVRILYDWWRKSGAGMQAMLQGDLAALGAYTDGQLMACGAGTMELLAWICLAGVMGQRRPTFSSYEAVKPWATGIGHLSYDLAA